MLASTLTVQEKFAAEIAAVKADIVKNHQILDSIFAELKKNQNKKGENVRTLGEVQDNTRALQGKLIELMLATEAARKNAPSEQVDHLKNKKIMALTREKISILELKRITILQAVHEKINVQALEQKISEHKASDEKNDAEFLRQQDTKIAEISLTAKIENDTPKDGKQEVADTTHVVFDTNNTQDTPDDVSTSEDPKEISPAKDGKLVSAIDKLENDRAQLIAGLARKRKPTSSIIVGLFQKAVDTVNSDNGVNRIAIFKKLLESATTHFQLDVIMYAFFWDVNGENVQRAMFDHLQLHQTIKNDKKWILSFDAAKEYNVTTQGFAINHYFTRMMTHTKKSLSQSISLDDKFTFLTLKDYFGRDPHYNHTGELTYENGIYNFLVESDQLNIASDVKKQAVSDKANKSILSEMIFVRAASRVAQIQKKFILPLLELIHQRKLWDQSYDKLLEILITRDPTLMLPETKKHDYCLPVRLFKNFGKRPEYAKLLPVSFDTITARK